MTTLTMRTRDCARKKLTTMILKRAAASRSSGEWSDDDYGVLAEAVIDGRIVKSAAIPVDAPGRWTLATGRTRPHPDARIRGTPRRRWRRSLRVGDRNSPPLCSELAVGVEIAGRQENALQAPGGLGAGG